MLSNIEVMVTSGDWWCGRDDDDLFSDQSSKTAFILFNLHQVCHVVILWLEMLTVETNIVLRDICKCNDNEMKT